MTDRTIETPWVEIEQRLRAAEPEVDDDLEPWRVYINPPSTVCSFHWGGCRVCLDHWVLEEVRKLLVDLESDPPSLQGSSGTTTRTLWSGKTVEEFWSISINKYNVTFEEANFPLRDVPTCLVIEAIRLLDQTRDARAERPDEIFMSGKGD